MTRWTSTTIDNPTYHVLRNAENSHRDPHNCTTFCFLAFLLCQQRGHVSTSFSLSQSKNTPTITNRLLHTASQKKFNHSSTRKQTRTNRTPKLTGQNDSVQSTTAQSNSWSKQGFSRQSRHQSPVEGVARWIGPLHITEKRRPIHGLETDHVAQELNIMLVMF